MLKEQLSKSGRFCLAAVLLFASSGAFAQPDVQGSQVFNEPNGAYTATKNFEVYLPGNPSDPDPLAGNFTYIYTITNSVASFVCLIGFDLEAPLGSVTNAGALAGVGIAPSATSVGAVAGTDVVDWDFLLANGACIGGVGIAPGQTSQQLVVHSIFGPGTVNDNMASTDGEFALDTPGTCTGPFVAPTTVGEPNPCTIGFWKNRAKGKKGLLKFFPDPQFDGLVTDAVALSGGLFANETELLTHLGSKGKRSIGERAKQQLAATLLNLAAGDLFPDNLKCALFEGNQIVTNACGDNITVAAAVSQALVDAVGDEDAQHDAQECSDDINNGIGLD